MYHHSSAASAQSKLLEFLFFPSQYAWIFEQHFEKNSVFLQSCVGVQERPYAL